MTEVERDAAQPGTDHSKSPDSLLTLACHFHTTARTEIITRIGHRDTTLFLYLAGAATLFGLSFSGSFKPVLYAIPLLGLGASQVYSQHSLVIGALGRYLGIESHEWLRRVYPDTDLPVQWDNSKSLLYMRGQGYMRPVYLSGLLLIVLPQILALATMAFSHPVGVAHVFGFIIGIISIVLATLSISSAFKARKAYAAELRDYEQVAMANPNPGDLPQQRAKEDAKN